jgi:hypothetical protein
MIDLIERKRENRKAFRKTLDKIDIGEVLSEKTKEELVNDFTEACIEEIREFEKVNEKEHEWITSGILFVYGIFIGVSGGLVANILHDLLMPIGYPYYIFAFLSFLASVYLVYHFIKEEMPGRHNKRYNELNDALTKSAEEILSKESGSQETKAQISS